MDIYVKKFGGSSLANQDRISHVANLILNSSKLGQQQVIVVSAMFGETDRLIDFASSFDHHANQREYAVLVSTGEQVSMSLLCMALAKLGVKAKSFNSNQAKIFTDSNHMAANIINVDCQNIKKCLDDGQIAVVAGFQGVDQNGDITTLGRGGSDTTAVALGAMLQAKECHIYTDVDGIYTADPKVVTKAAKLDYIDHQEMLVLSHMGAQVMQPRSVELAGKYKMAVKVLSSFHTTGGTTIREVTSAPVESPLVKSITCLHDQIKISIELEQACLSMDELLKDCYEENISLEMLNISTVEKTDIFECVVAKNSLNLFTQILEKNVNKNLIKSYNTLKNKSILSAVGLGLRGHNYSDILANILSILKDNNIEIFAICSADIRVSVLIDESCIGQALRCCHAGLGLDIQI